MKRILITTLAFFEYTSAQALAWGQCGGKGYSGVSTCPKGYSCAIVDEWFYQCQEGVPWLHESIVSPSDGPKTSASPVAVSKTTASSKAVPKATVSSVAVSKPVVSKTTTPVPAPAAQTACPVPSDSASTLMTSTLPASTTMVQTTLITSTTPAGSVVAPTTLITSTAPAATATAPTTLITSILSTTAAAATTSTKKKCSKISTTSTPAAVPTSTSLSTSTSTDSVTLTVTASIISSAAVTAVSSTMTTIIMSSTAVSSTLITIISSAAPTSAPASVTSTAPAVPSSSASPSSPAGIQYLGRINPDTKELTWPGTGIRFSYNGAAEIDITATGSNSGDLIIDGTTTVIPSVTDNIPLPSGSHSVEFRKRSEASLGSLFLSVSGTPASNKLIEFIGDSITVGYGLDGVLPCTNTAQIEDNPLTYAALAASQLGADYNVVAWSGKGVVRNIVTDTGPLMPELWTRYGADDADDSYPFTVQADVVVIALGTNDFTYVNARDPIDPSVYEDGMASFVTTVQGKYPSAKVFLMSSPMLQDGYPAGQNQHTDMADALKNVAAGAQGVYFVDWPTQGSSVGCDYHPNAATHAAEAGVLAQAIGEVMSW